MHHNFFDFALGKLKFNRERHQTLSSNVSRANIPGAKARDLEKFEKTFAQKHQLKMKHTAAGHMSGVSSQNRFKVILDKEANFSTPNGNNIDLVHQTFNIDKNNAEYKTSEAIIQNFIDNLNIVLSQGQK